MFVLGPTDNGNTTNVGPTPVGNGTKRKTVDSRFDTSDGDFGGNRATSSTPTFDGDYKRPTLGAPTRKENPVDSAVRDVDDFEDMYEYRDSSFSDIITYFITVSGGATISGVYIDPVKYGTGVYHIYGYSYEDLPEFARYSYFDSDRYLLYNELTASGVTSNPVSLRFRSDGTGNYVDAYAYKYSSPENRPLEETDSFEPDPTSPSYIKRRSKIKGHYGDGQYDNMPNRGVHEGEIS